MSANLFLLFTNVKNLYYKFILLYVKISSSEGDIMGKIVLFMGPSCSGKDTIFRKLMTNRSLKFSLKEIKMCTTRPIRNGEVEGREYYFKSEAEMVELQREKAIIEMRKYDTVYGPWYYFTTKNSMNLDRYNYAGLNTLEGYDQYLQYYGPDIIVPILINTDPGIRLERALKREKKELSPKYEEMCRRFLADAKDFSEENIGKRKITNIIDNNGSVDEALGKIDKILKLNL